MADIAIIIGAGPAGLTAAYEFLARSDTKVIILEKGDFIGGISRTVNYKGNRIDIGGHRFFSKSDRVMQWWQDIMPIEQFEGDPINDRLVKATSGNSLRMLERQRVSRIYYLRRFFDYPVKLNVNTIKNLGVPRIVKMGLAYLQVRAFPQPKEDTLEDFLINRFGTELYKTFFKDYTEKVWGVPCNIIKSEWGAQRIKGLSITSALKHAARSLLKRNGTNGTASNQKNLETSLIERFYYPKYGPGQLWEEVARRVVEQGGELHFNQKVVGIRQVTPNVMQVTTVDEVTGKELTREAKYVLSSMPVVELVEAIGETAPQEVRRVAAGLEYRDFMTAGLLVKKLKIVNETSIRTYNSLVPDNWIYVQENAVKLGRLQIFQNWSPYMVAEPDKIWLGLEYFCNVGDELWTKSDEDFLKFATSELESIGIIDAVDYIDGTVLRVEKTYPAYFGTYDEFSKIRKFTDGIENLFLIGRNGMHRYNNADHSMLSAMTAVDEILAGTKNKDAIWTVNTEQEYHEEK
jgi:protoporphyrinogen oxidase